MPLALLLLLMVGGLGAGCGSSGGYAGPGGGGIGIDGGGGAAAAGNDGAAGDGADGADGAAGANGGLVTGARVFSERRDAAVQWTLVHARRGRDGRSRRCGFVTFTDAMMSARSLYVVNVSRVAAGAEVTCGPGGGAANADCLLLTADLHGDTGAPVYHGTFFQGDTLVYYDYRGRPTSGGPA